MGNSDRQIARFFFGFASHQAAYKYVGRNHFDQRTYKQLGNLQIYYIISKFLVIWHTLETCDQILETVERCQETINTVGVDL